MLKLIYLAVAASAAWVGLGCTATQTNPEPLRDSITRINETWVCEGPVDLDYVSVVMTETGPAVSKADVGVALSPNCTGRIGYLSVVTYWSDAIRLAAHDLVIESGDVRCLGRNPDDHQDGVQSWQHARNVTFRNFNVRCYTANNSNFYLNSVPGETISNVICEKCFIGPNATSSVSLGNSIDSGFRDSLICAGMSASLSMRYGDATRPVDEGNQILRRSGPTPDPRCAVPAGIVDRGSYEATNGDFDHDGVVERLDNCWGMKNPGQADADGDGRGDVCDP